MLTDQRNGGSGQRGARHRGVSAWPWYTVASAKRPASVIVLMLVVVAAGMRTAWAGKGWIVTLAPSLTETVFALGAGDQVAGVGDYATFPPRVARLPRLGGLYNPNIERILELKPRLVLIPSPMPRLEAVCTRAGIRVDVIRMDGAGDLGPAILRLGRLLGRRSAARALLGSIRHRLRLVLKRTSRLPRIRVLLVIDRPRTGPLRDVTTVGYGSFIDTLVRTAGGCNIFSDVHQRYFTASLEEILRRRPQMIVEFDAGASHPKRLQREATRAWSELFGRRQMPRVRVVTCSCCVVPGPRAGLAAARLAAILHPRAVWPPEGHR